MMPTDLPILPVDIQQLIIEARDPDLSQFDFWRRTPLRSIFDKLTAEKCMRLCNFALHSSEKKSLARVFAPAPNDDQWKQLPKKVDLFLTKESSNEQIKAKKRAVLLYSLNKGESLPPDENDISKILKTGFEKLIRVFVDDFDTLNQPDAMKERAYTMLLAARAFLEQGVSVDSNGRYQRSPISAFAKCSMGRGYNENEPQAVEQAREEAVCAIFKRLLSESQFPRETIQDLLVFNQRIDPKKRELIQIELHRRPWKQRTLIKTEMIRQNLILTAKNSSIPSSCQGLLTTLAGGAAVLFPIVNLQLMDFWTNILPQTWNVRHDIFTFLRSKPTQFIGHALLFSLQANSFYQRPWSAAATHVGLSTAIWFMITCFLPIIEGMNSVRDANRLNYQFYCLSTCVYLGILITLISIQKHKVC